MVIRKKRKTKTTAKTTTGTRRASNVATGPILEAVQSAKQDVSNAIAGLKQQIEQGLAKSTKGLSVTRRKKQGLSKRRTSNLSKLRSLKARMKKKPSAATTGQLEKARELKKQISAELLTVDAELTGIRDQHRTLKAMKAEMVTVERATIKARKGYKKKLQSKKTKVRHKKS